MRYQVGAEELERVPSMAHRPDGTFRLVRSAPVGPTHAVAAASDAAACGIPARRLHLLFRLGPTAGSQVTQPRSVCPRTSRCNSSYTAAPYRTHGSRPFNPPVITDEASPFALRSTRNHPRRAVHRRCWLGRLRAGDAELRIPDPPAICQQLSLTSPQPAPCRFIAICVLSSIDMRQRVDAC
jgi:hypothetical protein